MVSPDPDQCIILKLSYIFYCDEKGKRQMEGALNYIHHSTVILFNVDKGGVTWLLNPL